MTKTYNTYLKLKDKPFGKKIFSFAVCRISPYFKSIRPTFHELRPYYCRVGMKNKRSVHNHIKSVHAIAMCNLAEAVAGLIMEASIPDHKRWIPVNMNVDYQKIARTDLMATCQFDEPDWETIRDLPLIVSVKDINDVEVVKAVITMRVSDKKKK